VIFADYDGLGVFLAVMLWLILTVPAFIAGLVGAVVGCLRHPRPRLVGGLGLVAGLLEFLGLAAVWLASRKESLRHVRDREVAFFWGLSISTLALSALALGLGLGRRRAPAVKKTGSGEL
jgi:hypothetical protein